MKMRINFWKNSTLVLPNSPIESPYNSTKKYFNNQTQRIKVKSLFFNKISLNSLSRFQRTNGFLKICLRKLKMNLKKRLKQIKIEIYILG